MVESQFPAPHSMAIKVVSGPFYDCLPGVKPAVRLGRTASGYYGCSRLAAVRDGMSVARRHSEPFRGVSLTGAL